MARLPVPGSDNGTWGDILNDFLTTSLEDDGTIKSSALSTKANTTHTHTQTDVTGLTAALAEKLTAADNLSDLTDVADARTNLAVYSSTEVDDAIDTSNSANTPIVVLRDTSSDLALADNGFTFTDTETGGTAAARPLDLVVPNVAVGQWVKVHVAFFGTAPSNGVVFTFATIVAGVRQHYMGTSLLGIASSGILSSTSRYTDFSYSYQIQSGDIAGGNVRLRLQHSCSGSGGSIATSGGFALFMEASGPFG